MEHPLTPEQEKEIIDSALRSLPAAAMPRSVTRDVMARVKTAPSPRFKFTPTDFVLAVVLTMVLGALLFGFQLLPGYVLLQLRIKSILLWQDLLVNARWLLPTILFGLAALLAAITIPSLYQMTLDRKR